MASTADKRRQAAALAAERGRQGAGGRLLKRSAAALLLLLFLTVSLLWVFGFFSSPEAVAAVKQLVDQQVAEYERVARGEAAFGAASGFGPLMEKMRDVPRGYRDQIGQQMGRLREARERAELASYFKLPPAQRQAELDRRIKADEKADKARREAWQAEREQRDQARAAGGQQAGVAAPERGRGDRGPGGAGRPGGGRTEDGRNSRSKERIDRTTPELRAQQAEYRRAIEARRKELGLPTGGRRGG